jgi:hypothetical protein
MSWRVDALETCGTCRAGASEPCAGVRGRGERRSCAQALGANGAVHPGRGPGELRDCPQDGSGPVQRRTVGVSGNHGCRRRPSPDDSRSGPDVPQALRGDPSARSLLPVSTSTPTRRLADRLAATAQPFTGDAPPSFDLEEIAADAGATFRRDRVAAVTPHVHRLRLACDAHLEYSALILAAGARGRVAIPGATTFVDHRDAPRLRRALDHAWAQQQSGRLRRSGRNDVDAAAVRACAPDRRRGGRARDRCRDRDRDAPSAGRSRSSARDRAPTLPASWRIATSDSSDGRTPPRSATTDWISRTTDCCPRRRSSRSRG